MPSELVSILICVGALLLIWCVARGIAVNSLRQQARTQLHLDDRARSDSLQYSGLLLQERLNEAELASYGAMTAAEYLWSWATIDHQLIHATDFASTATVKTGFDFSSYVHDHYDSLSTAGKEGFVNRLSGYLAEQKAAAILEHAGHSVQFADSASQPVWDLLVDGHMANVKNVADTVTIKGDALAHKDVIYLVPSDVHGHVGGNIVSLPGLHHDATKDAVNEGISTAKGHAALHGLGLHLPWITVGFAAYRNYRLVKDYNKDPLIAIKHATIESIGRGSGLVVGAKAGGIGGSLFGPIGAVIGAVVGGVAGAIAGGSLAEMYKLKPLRSAIEQFEVSLTAFGMSFAPHISAIRQFVTNPLTRMQQTQQELTQIVSERKSSFRYILWPDFYTILLDEARQSATNIIVSEQSRIQGVTTILDNAKRHGKWMPLGVLMANAPEVRYQVGYNQHLLDDLVNARQIVFRERKHLNPQFQSPD